MIGCRFGVQVGNTPRIRRHAGPTASAVWTAVVRQVAARRAELDAARREPGAGGGRGGQPSVSGPEYFGFAAPTIARLIQELPGAERCGAYVMQDLTPNVPTLKRPSVA